MQSLTNREAQTLECSATRAWGFRDGRDGKDPDPRMLRLADEHKATGTAYLKGYDHGARTLA